MQIFLAKDGKQTGPFPEEQVRAMLADGRAAPGDLCWYEGQPAWLPVSQVLGLAVTAPPALPPLPYITTQPAASPGQGASRPGFLLRFVGYIIDTVIVRVILYPLSFVVDLSFGGSSPTEADIPAILGGSMIGLVAGWLYYAAMESSTKQATVGAIALGFCVTDLDGKRISFARASGRYFGMILSAMIFCIGFMMCAWTERKQCLHDMIAGCLMIKK